MKKIYKSILIILAIVNSYSGYSQYVSSESLVPYRVGKLWGYSDYEGNIKIKPQYQSASLFFKYRAIVKKNGLFYLIDMSNNLITKNGYEFMEVTSSFNNVNVCYTVRRKGKQFTIDSEGIIKQNDCEGQDMKGSDGWDEDWKRFLIKDTFINSNRFYYFILDSAKIPYKFIYQLEAGHYFKNYFCVGFADTLSGIVFNDGNKLTQILPCLYHEIEPIYHEDFKNRFIISRSKKYALFMDAKQITTFKYANISKLSEIYYRQNILYIQTDKNQSGYLNIEGFEYFKD